MNIRLFLVIMPAVMEVSSTFLYFGFRPHTFLVPTLPGHALFARLGGRARGLAAAL